MATQVTSLDTARQEDSHRWPSILPDGKHFLYLRRSTIDEKTGIFLGSLDSKEYSAVVPMKSGAIYASPGYVLYIQERSLMAQPYDAGYSTENFTLAALAQHRLFTFFNRSSRAQHGGSRGDGDALVHCAALAMSAEVLKPASCSRAA